MLILIFLSLKFVSWHHKVGLTLQLFDLLMQMDTGNTINMESVLPIDSTPTFIKVQKKVELSEPTYP